MLESPFPQPNAYFKPIKLAHGSSSLQELPPPQGSPLVFNFLKEEIVKGEEKHHFSFPALICTALVNIMWLVCADMISGWGESCVTPFFFFLLPH